jgi:hypothetical protein
LKTVTFIGSDKNAGKTTAMNYAIDTNLTKNYSKICLTSIGINGEATDAYEGTSKPLIKIKKKFYFITSAKHLINHTGKYKIINYLMRPVYKNDYIFGQALLDFNLILEGPNEKFEILQIKKFLEHLFADGLLIIDGSIDRQFLAHPEICDQFYFSLLISDRKEQLKKAKNLIAPISFPKTQNQIYDIITKHKEETTKTFLINEQFEIIHHGKELAFTDDSIKHVLRKNINTPLYLYLNGALTKSLFHFLAPLKKLIITLDNFTLFQNIDLFSDIDLKFFPKIEILNLINVETIFIRQESGNNRIELPSTIRIVDIFKDLAIGKLKYPETIFQTIWPKNSTFLVIWNCFI